jgi:hypothetical protein
MTRRSHDAEIVVFSFVKVTPGTVIPSARIASFLARELDARLTVGSPLKGESGIGSPRVLVVVNGAYAFMRDGADLGRAIEQAERVVWVQNDYTVVPPISDGEATSPFRRAFVARAEQGKSPMDFWTTCERTASATRLSRRVNWNAMAFEPVEADRSGANDRLLYYGAFRAGRRIYFDRYFSAPTVPITVSTTARPGLPNKFQESYGSPMIEHLEKFTGELAPHLSRHGAGLYVEDKRSHSESHSPANRFYEMLSAGLPIVFQQECGAMLRRAGIDPTPFVANTPREVERLMARRAEIGSEQRRLWIGGDYRRRMMDQFCEARDALREALR